MKFKNKQYLITGVTSGLGKALAEDLIENGARVLGIGRDFSKIESNRIFNENINFTFKSVDLTSIEDIEFIVNEFCLKEGKFDGFVHCAGKEETIPLRIYDTKKIESLFTINVFVGIELIRILSKKKYSNDGSSLVLLSSVMGGLGQPGKVGYCASKASVLGVVKASSLELAKRKIRVNSVSPGVVDTPMTQQLFKSLSNENIESIINMHPLGIGEVSDVVPMLTFLLSDKSKWITGQNFILDGGYSIQ
jgi:NAD(P)-dependent dehydrogenase (short-subunit alcohol dehydrogenase family)